MVNRLVIITGMSGAGKSTAMSILEDLGYHCVDHFPSELMPEFVKLLEKKEGRYTNVALSTTLSDFPAIYAEMSKAGIRFETLFLSAGPEQLVARYKFTRHLHPLIADGEAATLAEAIRLERRLLDQMTQYPGAIYLDTGGLKYQDLKNELEQRYSLNFKRDFSVTFESFGYKHGIPQDADFLFDVRLLPNPYWVPELRELTGDDEKVYHYVIANELSEQYLERLTAFLDLVFANYEKDGRNHIIIGIGCTGGQHRSVAVVNYLMRRYQEKYRCLKDHREHKDGLR